LAGAFFTVLLGAAFFFGAALGFRGVLFLVGLLLLPAAVLFLGVAVLPAFALFDFDTVELRPLEVLFLRAADAVVLPEVFFAELPLLVFLPTEVLFLGIAVLLLIQIHSISVFLFMW